MAKTRITSRLPCAVTVFFRVRLPPDFMIPYSAPDRTESHKMVHNKWTRCFRALCEVNPRDMAYIKCGRQVEDPASTIIFISTYSSESMDALLNTPQYKDCLTSLGLAQPPALVRTVKLIISHELKQGRMTIATFSFPYPATQEQRDAFYHAKGIQLTDQISKNLRPHGWSARYWVCGPQKLPDGREVENALILRVWNRPEDEDTAAGEEREKREHWMRAVTEQLGLLAISVERDDIYPF